MSFNFLLKGKSFFVFWATSQFLRTWHKRNFWNYFTKLGWIKWVFRRKKIIFKMFAFKLFLLRFDTMWFTYKGKNSSIVSSWRAYTRVNRVNSLLFSAYLSIAWNSNSDANLKTFLWREETSVAFLWPQWYNFDEFSQYFPRNSHRQ